MRKKYPFWVPGIMLLFILACIVPNKIFAQNLKEISGVVKSDAGPLQGVSVTVKEVPKIGVTTDENGNYSLKIPTKSTLVFKSIGYKTVEMPVNGRSSIDLNMEISNVNLAEVVVVGYGTQKKATLTGAVSVVKGNEIAKSSSAEISYGLAVLAPGAIATNNSGQPGNGGSKIYIRG